MFDLVGFVLDIAKEGDLEHDTIDQAISRASQFLSQTAENVIATKGCQPAFSIDCAASASEACRVMLKHDVWRLLVTRSDAPLSVLTAGDFLRFIGSGREKRPDQTVVLPREKLEQTLEEAQKKGFFPRLNIGKEGIATCSINDSLFKCLSNIGDEGAVGVLDLEGKIYGNVSAWDLKSLNHHSLIAMSKPTKDFLKVVRQAAMIPEDYLITVTTKSTIGQFLKKIVACVVHRIYVVDEEKRPIGIVSSHDLLQFLL
eukprot:Plantae.Rhodophyta-Palmaria_palmata.ctg30061.p1 GENE.Plantae.Rhodophyta-Palmaria_palmata.ctg30061~~Plantae.Rhodophyta-Palmaria_palmata.ctg30061.p1  ORF type:complete len:281 (-),score=61.34 Plantae.Rhodophyta-Palmaria_palmata.ctg30061:3-773(-)